MNKKVILIIILSGICLMLSGCKNSDETEGKTEKPQSVASGNVTIKEKLKEEYPTVTDISQFGKITESQDFNFDTDCQYYAESCYICTESADSIYFEGEDKKINVFNKLTGTVSMLCGKAECNHEDHNCNAYFGNIANMFHYKNSIYVLVTEQREKTDGNNNYLVDLNMYKVSSDGLERELVTSLYTMICDDGMFASVSEYSVNCIQHRGYLYYLYNIGTGDDESTFYNYGSNCIHRMNLENFVEDEKCIAYMPVGSDYQFLSLMAKGSYVYYLKGDEYGFGEVYRFNTETMINEKMNMGIIAREDWKILGNEIVYKKDWQSFDIYKYNPNTGKEELFLNMESCEYKNCYDFITDEKYIYVNCKDNIDDVVNYIVFDYAGKRVGQIKGDGILLAGRFVKGINQLLRIENDGLDVYYLNESQIASGEAKYIKIQ